ncbi:MAG: hydroxyphenylacetyl-CoA thioesterase PaaI [Vulcanimicrobiaceae bacterium]
MLTSDEADALAQRCADAMYARDIAAQSMGISVIEVRRGFARVEMDVRPEMLNGHEIAHGGFIFALADTAFAYACNSRNQPNVAVQCSISFVAPARRDDRLVGVAEERAHGGRIGTYDVSVARADGTLLALFRGVPYRINGTVLDPA